MRCDQSAQLGGHRNRSAVLALVYFREQVPDVILVANELIANLPQPLGRFRVGNFGELIQFGRDGSLAASQQFPLSRFTDGEPRVAEPFTSWPRPANRHKRSNERRHGEYGK